MTPLFKTRIILLIGLFSIVFGNANAQLDTKHWIPPFYAKPGTDSGTTNLRNHFVSLSTPTTDTIPVTITNGYGEVISVVEISRDLPMEYQLGPVGNANNDIYPLNVIPTDSLNLKIRSQGLHFSSYQPFFVNMRHKAGSQGTSLTSKGQVALGKRFYSGHIYTIYNEGSGADDWNNNRRSHFISVMATEDNTVVTFDMIKDPINYIGHTLGDDIVVTLDAMESYTIGIDHGQYDNLTINNANGTRITSTKAIVCNSGSWLSGNESGQCIGTDQMVPAEVTGQEYILVKGLGDETTERPMAIATEDGTSIFINGSPTPAAVLDEGEFYAIPTSEFSADDNMYVLATEKVFMYQTLSGSSTNIGPTVGLNFIPPLNCIGAKEVILPFVNSLAGGIGQGQINIITKSGTTIHINESPTPLTGSVPVPGNNDWVTYAFNPPTENVIIESDSVMNVALLTYDAVVGSAGYFSGFTLEPVVGLSAGVSGSQPCIPGNAVLQVFGFDAYQWYFNGEEIEGETGSTLFPEFSGDYVVEGLDLACGFRFPSNSFAIPFCPSTLGAAKGVQNVSETAPGSKIFDVTYRIFIENLAISATDNIQIIENINGGLPTGATAELIGTPVLAFGILTGGVNPDFDGITDRRLLPGNGGLPGGASDAIDITVRVDMNAAEQDGYQNQVTVTSRDGEVNNGVDGPFNGQDFSDEGTNPDSNGNGEPNEEGENDLTLTCFFSNEITYDELSFCTADTEKLVTIEGVAPGLFTADLIGLELDSLTGTITPADSEPGTYTVTLTVPAGRCIETTTTAEVTIVAQPIPGEPVANTEVCVESDAINLDDYLQNADAGGTWTDGDGNAIDGTFEPFAPGEVDFVYTVSASPCQPQSVLLSLQVITAPVPGDLAEDLVACMTDGQATLSDYLEGEDAGGTWYDANGAEVDDLIDLTTAGVNVYTYTVENNGCGTRSIDLPLNVVAFPEPGVPVGDETICAGEDLDLFDFLVAPDLDGVWTTADGTVLDPNTPIHLLGTFTLTYTIDRGDCGVAAVDIVLTVVQGPNGGIPNNPNLICTDAPAFNLLDMLPGADAGGEWTDEDGNVVSDYFDPETAGVYAFTYTVTNDVCGNIRSDVILDVAEENCGLGVVIIPQGFSPNNDGVGDFWIIQGLLEGHPNHKVRIFNRWGNLVYSAGPYNNDWDGTSESGLNSGEPLPVGTYFYTIDFGDETESKKGYVYLNR